MTEPVRMEDGSIENFMPYIRDNPQSFSCRCGCNVFHKPDNNDLDLFKCNACGTEYK